MLITDIGNEYPLGRANVQEWFLPLSHTLFRGFDTFISVPSQTCEWHWICPQRKLYFALSTLNTFSSFDFYAQLCILKPKSYMWKEPFVYCWGKLEGAIHGLRFNHFSISDSVAHSGWKIGWMVCESIVMYWLKGVSLLELCIPVTASGLGVGT